MKSVLAGQSNTLVGMLVMIPNVLGLIAMIVVSRHSDHALERRNHMATSVALAGFALLLLGAPRSPHFSVALFSVVAMGTYSFLPVFFSVPGEFLTGFSAAAGIALVTSVANLGGFIGPYTVGLIRQKTGSSYSGLICAGIFFLSQRPWHCRYAKPPFRGSGKQNRQRLTHFSSRSLNSSGLFLFRGNNEGSHDLE